MASQMPAEPRFATYPEIVRLREMLNQGMSYRECASRMHETPGRIAGMIRRHLSCSAPSVVKRKRYEDDRRAWRMAHPIVESSASFVVTPALELERAERIARSYR